MKSRVGKNGAALVTAPARRELRIVLPKWTCWKGLHAMLHRRQDAKTLQILCVNDQ
jgi:hypothetical protein